jgi:succinoglycan biosynthesis transport protein ExoP
MSDLAPSKNIRALPTYLPAEPLAGGSLGGGFGGAQHDGSEAPLREYGRILFKYRHLVGAAALVGLLLALIYAFTATPLYTAESKIRISTYEPILAATKIEDMLEQKSKEANYLETQIEEIKSFSLADKVLTDPQIKEAFELRKKPGLFASLFGGGKDDAKPALPDSISTYQSSVEDIRSYLNGIEVRPVRRTSLVAIRATSDDPVLAALIANRHSVAYQDWVRSSRMAQQARGLKFLRGQADELREKVADTEREIADYAEANSIIALNKDENIIAQKLSLVSRQLTEVTAKRIEAENLYGESLKSLESSSAGFDDVSTQTMRSELAKLEAEFGQLRAKFTDSYPRVAQLRSQIAELKRSIEGQRRQIVTGLKAKAAAAAEEEKNLQEELEQQKSRAFELSKKQVQYNVLNRELTSSRDLLENVLRQIKETSLAVESNSSNISIVDYPTVPLSPSQPRKKLVVFLGVLLGLGVGIGLAFLLSYLDNTVRTPEDVAAVLQLPALGVVPAFDTAPPPPGEPASLSSSLELQRVDAPQSDLPIVFLQSPKSLAAEAYRTIRTGVLLSQAGEPPRTILVTSAQSSEGKTTSTVNIAISLASSGGRVVLIDADLRRPAIHRHFNLDRERAGLVDILTGQRTVEEVAMTDLVKRVTFISSGPIPPNPAELLGSLEMASLIDRLASEYDYVLIDSPPVLPVTDSVILSRYVDGVVLVLKGASTPRRVVNDARKRLQSVGARILGVVLNHVDVTSGDYYYYNRYYSAYYREETETQSSRSASS